MTYGYPALHTCSRTPLLSLVCGNLSEYIYWFLAFICQSLGNTPPPPPPPPPRHHHHHPHHPHLYMYFLSYVLFNFQHFIIDVFIAIISTDPPDNLVIRAYVCILVDLDKVAIFPVPRH